MKQLNIPTPFETKAVTTVENVAQIAEDLKRLRLNRNSQTDWPAPEVIKSEMLAVQPMLEEMLPDPFRHWLADIAHRIQCPLDFVAAAAIVMTSSIIGAGCGIRPKERDDWTVIPNLWGGVIGRPGMLKSPAIAEALKPLRRLEEVAKDDYEDEARNYSAELAAFESEKKALRDKMVKGAKSSNKQVITDLTDEFKNLDAPSPPPWRRYRTNDSTIEKISRLLSENDRGILVSRDELIGLLSTWDRDGHEGDRAYYLEAWTGSGNYTSDRVGAGTIYSPNLCVSIFGGIQPSKLIVYLSDAVNNQKNDGLIQRFQLLVYPDASAAWEYVDQYPNQAEKNRAFLVIEKLAAMDFNAYGATLEKFEKIPCFHFAGDAQAFFISWLTALEHKVRASDESPIMVEHLNKYRSLMPSLALIFHLIEVADAQASGAVTLRSTEMAVRWCDYLESHARRIYGLVGNGVMQAATRLARKIEAGALTDGFTARDVYIKQWSLLEEPSIAKGAIEHLVEAGWLRQVATSAGDSSKGGRPALPSYVINPALKNSGEAPR